MDDDRSAGDQPAPRLISLLYSRWHRDRLHGAGERSGADHPLYFGNLREQSLAALLDAAETNVALHMLRVWDRVNCCNCWRTRVMPTASRVVSGAKATAISVTRSSTIANSPRPCSAHPRPATYRNDGLRACFLSEGGNTMSPEAQEAETAFCENIGFLMTYRCQVACPHCIIRAGPHRTEEIPRPTSSPGSKQSRSSTVVASKPSASPAVNHSMILIACGASHSSLSPTAGCPR